MSNARSTPDLPSTPEQLARWGRERHRAVEQDWLARRSRVFLGFECLLGGMVLLLGRAGYPAWRVAGLLLAFGVQTGIAELHLWSSRTGTHDFFGKREHRGLAITSLLLLCCGLSGGIRSPLLVLPILAYCIDASFSPGLRATLRSLTLNVVGVLALALLPTRWTGPLVPEPLFTVLALSASLIGISLLADVLILNAAALTRSLGELARARDDVASQALARARELERVSAQLSHELKNPLAAVKALVQVLQRRISDPEAREQLQVAESEVERMGVILREHLTFSRPLAALAPETTELADLVDGVVAALSARAAAAGVSLARVGSGEAPVDRPRLMAALINLVANAIEASPRGGVVSIEIGRGEAEACIAVRDRGAGMSAELLQRIGTPFFTTREHGTGLGVSLARTALGQHGGRLEYRSAPGAGTTALCTIPLVPTPASGDAYEPRSTLRAAAGGPDAPAAADRSFQPPPSAR